MSTLDESALFGRVKETRLGQASRPRRVSLTRPNRAGSSSGDMGSVTRPSETLPDLLDDALPGVAAPTAIALGPRPL